MANQDFEDLSRSILDEILSWDPSFATQLGWHRYDHHLMDPRRKAFERQSERLSEFVQVLESLDDGDLTEDEQIDRDLAVYLFRLRIFEISRMRVHEQMSLAEEEIGRSLFFLFFRDNQPLEARFDAIVSRLEKTPQFLEWAKTALVNPCRTWVEISMETGKRLPAFLNTVRETAAAKLESREQADRLSEAVDTALDAIKEYESWLEKEILPRSSPTSSIGAEEFEEYLRLKSLGVTQDEALEIAELGLKSVNEQRKMLAREISPSGLLKDAIHEMKKDSPATFEEALRSYRECIAEARDFVMEKDLVTIPDDEKLIVIETPNFMRHLAPFAAQYEPGKFSSDRKGLFLVTPDDGNPELLKEHCSAMVWNTAVHEGYPGHHLQGICGNMNSSHIRVMSTAPSFAEGWALYCERMMISEGFRDGPLRKLAQLNDLAFRVVRVIADVSLARKTMVPDEVAEMLVAQTGMERQAALNEARSYTYEMTCYLSYFIGMLGLLQLRKDVRKALGERFDQKDFHDSILNAGCLPVHYMREVEKIRLRRDFGIDLPDSSESLLDFTRSLTLEKEPF
ncbi:TPA: DUF885 domain-containing protein [Thermoplasmata archaeon]|nr:DUF885 domain-containing protein [Thermoplasmata archaeon]